MRQEKPDYFLPPFKFYVFALGKPKHYNLTTPTKFVEI